MHPVAVVFQRCVCTARHICQTAGDAHRNDDHQLWRYPVLRIIAVQYVVCVTHEEAMWPHDKFYQCVAVGTGARSAFSFPRSRNVPPSRVPAGILTSIVVLSGSLTGLLAPFAAS